MSIEPDGADPQLEARCSTPHKFQSTVCTGRRIKYAIYLIDQLNYRVDWVNLTDLTVSTVGWIFHNP